MQVITININNKSFKIGSPEGKENEILEVVNLINSKVEELKISSPLASTEYLLLLASISIGYELNNFLKNQKEDPASNQKILDIIAEFSSYLEKMLQK